MKSLVEWERRRLGVGLGLSILLSSASAAEFDCLIEPRQVVELRSPMEGLIDKINVDRGDYVRKGDEVAVLDIGVDRVQAAMAQLRSQMDGAVWSWESRGVFSAKKFGRLDELAKENLMSVQLRDEAATEKRIAEAELRDAIDNRKLAELEYKRQLEIIRLKTIRSPVSGVVTERLQNPGELSEAGSGRKAMLKIADIDLLHVEVLLPVEAFGRVRVGTAVFVSPEIPVGAKLRATVKIVDAVFDAASRTFGVRLELPNPQRKIPGGSRCRVEFPEIPESASHKLRKAASMPKL